MNSLLNWMNQIKLSITSWLLIALTSTVGILLLIIGYKSKQLHGLQVQLLAQQFHTQLEASQEATLAADRASSDTYLAYQAARELYVKIHGPL